MRSVGILNVKFPQGFPESSFSEICNPWVC
ncbi:hypothetical protein AYI69_g9365, partial [Smittium culicis]